MAESDFLFSKLLHAVKKKRKERRMEEDRKRKKETSFYNFQAPSSKMSRKKTTPKAFMERQRTKRQHAC